jgi:hypothetical protein
VLGQSASSWLHKATLAPLWLSPFSKTISSSFEDDQTKRESLHKAKGGECRRMLFYKALLLSWLALSSVLATFNFDNYPECAQTICYEFAPPSCDFGSATDTEAEQTNYCLCTNTGFISDLAAQIFQTCGCQSLTTSAQTFNDNCARHETVSVVSVEDFISLGDGGHTSCGSTGLDLGLKVAIAFGVLGLLVALVIGILQLAVSVLGLDERYRPWPYIRRFCCCCCRSRRNRYSSGSIPLPPYVP